MVQRRPRSLGGSEDSWQDLWMVLLLGGSRVSDRAPLLRPCLHVFVAWLVVKFGLHRLEVFELGSAAGLDRLLGGSFGRRAFVGTWLQARQVQPAVGHAETLWNNSTTCRKSSTGLELKGPT